MAPECCLSAAHRAAHARPARIPWTALLSGLLLVLVPKCPLCVAAYLTVVGISAGAAAALAHVIHPLILLVAALSLVLLVVRIARRISDLVLVLVRDR